MLLWSSLTYTSNKNSDFFSGLTINRYLQEFIFYWWLHNLWIMQYPIIRIFLNFCIGFSCPLQVEILYHNTLPDLIVLVFVLAAPNLWTAVFLHLIVLKIGSKNSLRLSSLYVLMCLQIFTVVNKPFNSWYHGYFQGDLILVLFATFTIIFVQSFNIFHSSTFIKRTVSQWLVNSNGDHIFLQLIWLAYSSNNNTLLLKWFNWNNCFNILC